MQITAAQKRRVAVFFILGTVLFLGLIALLIGNRLLKRERCFYTQFQNLSVAGLSEGSGVKFQGMAIGQVRTISIDATDTSIIRCDFCLKPGVPIKEGTFSTMGNIGITGLKFIELKGGGTGDNIPEGGLIPGKKSSWDEISGKATVITNKIEAILNRSNILVKEIDPKMVPGILTDIHEITTFSKTYIKDNAPRLITLSDDSHNVMIQLEKTLKESELTLKSVREMTQQGHLAIKNLNQGVNRINKLLAPGAVVARTLKEAEGVVQKLNKSEIAESFIKLNKVLNDIGKTVGTVNLLLRQSQEAIINSFESLSEGLEYFSEFSRTIMENPSAILRGSEDQ